MSLNLRAEKKEDLTNFTEFSQASPNIRRKGVIRRIVLSAYFGEAAASDDDATLNMRIIIYSQWGQSLRKELPWMRNTHARSQR